MVMCTPYHVFWYKKLFIMALSFGVTFTLAFVYLYESYNITLETTLAIAGPSASMVGLGATFSVYFR